MSRKVARYGWIPDIPDARDHAFATPRRTDPLPRSVDLRDFCPPVYDQGNLGSCTANAIAAAVEYERLRQGLTAFMPSRLFIYYNERAIEGTVNEDSGAMIRDGIKSIASIGACAELDWPYNIQLFTAKPEQKCYDSALKDRAVKYGRVAQSEGPMMDCLASGFPIVIGFSVYEGFESEQVAKTGIVNLPTRGEQMLGGHAVLVVGYDRDTSRFLVRNSWGTGWGDNGYFTMPFAYLTDSNLSDDFWNVQLFAE